MTAVGGIVGFVVHALLIWLGAKVAKIERAGFWQSVAVALISYLIMMVLKWLLLLLLIIPWVNVLVLALILFFATAVAAKLVFNCKWEPAWTIAVVVTIANVLLSWLF